MISIATVRELALAFPETDEHPHFDRKAFRVKKKIFATLDEKNPNQKVLGNLIGALALDPSVNVRLSALDALYPHADQQVVRAGVLASLPREQNPLVQVAMIDFLVAARDRDATPELERLARTETLDRAVRDAAKRGLAQL